MSTYIRLTAALCALALFPLAAFAQQLRLVEGNTTTIDPTEYRAYYGQLAGEPHIYTFSTKEADTPVKLLLLVPDVPKANTNVSATLINAEDPSFLFFAADGGFVEWQRFFDTSGRDSYLAGPSIDTTVPAGSYRIQVSSPADDAKYVLIVSGEPGFSLTEVFRRYATVPTIKSEFFGKPAIHAYVTPLLLWPIFGLLIIAGLIVLMIMIYRRRTPRIS